MNVDGFGQASCTLVVSPPNYTVVGLDSSCATNLSNYAAFQGSPVPATGGTCAGSPSNPTEPPFGQYAQGCTGGVGGACTNGVCATDAAKLCVAQAGSQTCPPGYATTRIVLDTQFSDGRTCSPCTCTTTQGTCTATIALYTDATCNGGLIAKLPLDGTSCLAPGASVVGGATVVTPGVPVGAGCSLLGGGVPGGQVSPTAQVTVCCAN